MTTSSLRSAQQTKAMGTIFRPLPAHSQLILPFRTARYASEHLSRNLLHACSKGHNSVAVRDQCQSGTSSIAIGSPLTDCNDFKLMSRPSRVATTSAERRRSPGSWVLDRTSFSTLGCQSQGSYTGGGTPWPVELELSWK